MASHAMLALVGDTGRECLRRNARHRVLLSATLLTTTDEFRVRLRDLSATGAKVEGARLPPPGTDVVLKRGALELFGSVAWREEDHSGIQFEDPVEEAELLRAVGCAAPASPAPSLEPYRRPGFRTPPPSPEELELAREWARPASPQRFGE